MYRASVKKSVRLTMIPRLLQGRPMRTRELADYFGVSTNCIQRDMLDLQSEPLRVPLVQDDDWYWSILNE